MRSRGSPPGPTGGPSCVAPPRGDRLDAVTMRSGTQLSNNLPKLPSYLIILKNYNILPLLKIPSGPYYFGVNVI
jgi:hypothetical protein